jgi:hypothetical protein
MEESTTDTRPNVATRTRRTTILLLLRATAGEIIARRIYFFSLFGLGSSILGKSPVINVV